MSHHAVRRVFTIFIASPGDLTEERAIAREVVERINRVIGKHLGFTVELLGWEDTRPGVSRPQALINKDVDRCDLFLGVVWKRWGTQTGEWDSGFHEEFERARERRKSSGTPEMWLCFKHITPDQLADPGDQLKKVLEFKKEQQALRELLYKEFQDASDWGKQLNDWLSDHLLETFQEVQGEKSNNLSPATLTRGSQSAEFDTKDNSSDSQQKATAQLQLWLQQVAEKGSEVMQEADARSPQLSRAEVSRLHLLSTALLAEREAGIYLGTQEINLLHLDKEQIQPSSSEKHLIFYTLLTDQKTFGAKPGWFWLRNSEVVQSKRFSSSRRSENRIRTCAMLPPS